MNLSPELGDLAIYLVGWTLGWLLLWRLNPLPQAPQAVSEHDTAGSGVAVVIPARNEARSLPNLLPALVRQLGPNDQLVVVDDQSDDGTGELAVRLGAVVVSPPTLPNGWLGKPHACWQGAIATDAPTVLFLDADVRPPDDLLVRIEAAVDAHPSDVTSVQPWHRTERLGEQASVLSNVAALMGCGAFSLVNRNHTAAVAFGPVLALRRAEYDRVGGHANPTIRRMHTEDIGLARAVGHARLYTGAPDLAFRMYPTGFLEAVRGWTRSLATGARFAPFLAAVGTLAWMCSLAGGWLATPLVYPLSAIQVWVLGRRAGSIHPATALLYPVAVVVFAVIFVRSLLAMLFRREVVWKGRQIDAR